MSIIVCAIKGSTFTGVCTKSNVREWTQWSSLAQRNKIFVQISSCCFFFLVFFFDWLRRIVALYQNYFWFQWWTKFTTLVLGSWESTAEFKAFQKLFPPKSFPKIVNWSTSTVLKKSLSKCTLLLFSTVFLSQKTCLPTHSDSQYLPEEFCTNLHIFNKIHY